MPKTPKDPKPPKHAKSPKHAKGAKRGPGRPRNPVEPALPLPAAGKVLQFPGASAAFNAEVAAAEAAGELETVRRGAEMTVRLKGVGRPPRLTVELLVRVLTRVRETYVVGRVAAAAEGVKSSTYESWLESADRPRASPIFRLFRNELLRAEAEAESLLAHRAALKDPLKILERRFRENWRPPVEAVVVDTPPASGNMSADELRNDLARRIARRAPA